MKRFNIQPMIKARFSRHSQTQNYARQTASTRTLLHSDCGISASILCELPRCEEEGGSAPASQFHWFQHLYDQ